MPLIQVKLVEGTFTEAQKQEIVQRLTDAMLSIGGKNGRPVTWVIVEEIFLAGIGGSVANHRERPM
jgi:4-oxalocrotonate tautomerase